MYVCIHGVHTHFILDCFSTNCWMLNVYLISCWISSDIDVGDMINDVIHDTFAISNRCGAYTIVTLS